MLERLSNKRKNPVWTIIITAAFCLLAALLFRVLFSSYENGIIDISARQQDGYVKLVVDQIKLQPDNTSDEIVTDILSSLDASDSRYWTFADDGSIVFIKNTLETNQYQSISASRYFAEQGASDFLSSLRQDRVTHQTITLNGEKYTASGIIFTYANRNYQLILLTSVKMILENNIFLEAKTELYAVILLTLLVIFILNVVHVLVFNRTYDGEQAQKEQNEKLRRIIEERNQMDLEKKVLDPRKNIFPIEKLNHALDEIIDKKEAFPLSLLFYAYPDEDSRNAFLHEAGLFIDTKDILFDSPEKKVLILMAMRTDASAGWMQGLKKKYRQVEVTVYFTAAEIQKDLKK